MIYDYIIVGAGPAGLSLAWYLSKHNLKILIIDREKDIGGCHRVRRSANDEGIRRIKDEGFRRIARDEGIRMSTDVERFQRINNNTNYYNGAFTEHGPRIYSGTYQATWQLLNEMNISFDNYFTKMYLGLSNIGGKGLLKMSIYEYFILTMEYIIFIFYPQRSQKLTVKELMDKYNFSEQSKDYLDRLVRFTDGASAEKYLLYKFFQLINQVTLYPIYQPKLPNDLGLFKEMRKKINADIILNNLVENIGINQDIVYVNTKNNKIYYGKNLVLAIPPENIVEILEKSEDKNIFGDFNKLKYFAEYSKYLKYISMTFHWNHKLKLNKTIGFPATSWGIGYIVLSDYFENYKDKTLISTAITIADKPSEFTGKTADETNENELKKEVLRQLKISFPELTEPDMIIISPGDYYENNSNGNCFLDAFSKKSKYSSIDKAFIDTKIGYISPFSKYPNIFNVGTHNGNSFMGFTCMESAINNSIALYNHLYPKSKVSYPPIFTLNIFLCIIIIIILLIILIIKYKIVRKLK